MNVKLATGRGGGAWLTPRQLWVLRLIVTGLALASLFLYLRGFYRQELYHFTGGAQWIWISDDVRAPEPTACVFYRILELHERPLEAVAKVCGDRSYVLWINGQPALSGYNRPDYHLDVVSVTDLLAPGPNLIAIEARSPTSVGGVLFSLDLVPSEEGWREGDPRGRNVLVSDRSWRVLDRAWPGFPGRAPAGGRVPWVWGRPPDHPWVYPAPIRYQLPLAQATRGDEVRIPSAKLRRNGQGVWRYDLHRLFTGLLWLEGKLPPSATMKIRVSRHGEPDSRAPFRTVVVLPGQTRWLVAGIVRGSVLEIKSETPPPSIVLMPLQPGAAP